MIVAVTGASGFLGRAVCAELVRRGHAARGLARTGRAAPAGVEAVRGDLLDAAALDALFAGADGAIHCAALMGSRDEAALDRTNVQGTRAALAAARRAGVRRVVLVSSVAAARPEHGPYSRSKAAAELVARAARDERTSVAILRPPVLVGPGAQVERAILAAASRGVVPAPSGAPLRPLPVEDAAAACLAALEPGAVDRTLAGPEALTFPALARRVLAGSGRRAVVVPLPPPVALLAAALAERLPRPPLTVEAVRAILAGSPPAGPL